MALNTIDEILDDLRAGKMVIIVDDEGRENEGDLVMAASLARAEDINFMARYGRGLICLTVTRERCRQLNLPLMVGATDDQRTTNFTVSIEARQGVTTGISAQDRAHTIRTAVAPNARPEDIVQPGHVFPLMAQPGGVLTRAGHTEAGCDLAGLAGLEPTAVIVEILNEDGSMARRPELEVFARAHGLKLGTIEALIRYRIDREHTVERVAEVPFYNEFGAFTLRAYQDLIGRGTHLALIKGEISPDRPTLVRVHPENTLCDTLGVQSPQCGWPLKDALRRITEAGEGVAVILRISEVQAGIIEQIHTWRFNPQRAPSGSPRSDRTTDRRTFGIGGQILADIGVRKMRLMSAPQRFHALGGFGLEIVEYVSE